MFRIDSDAVVDATMAGGPARYINHSCDVSYILSFCLLFYALLAFLVKHPQSDLIELASFSPKASQVFELIFYLF